MFLYRIKSTGEFVPTKPTGKADLFEKVEIPANGNRVAMCEYLNGLVAKPAVEALTENDHPIGIAADGHPDHRCAYTRALVDTMFAPRSPHLRELCYQISKLRGRDLGQVAFEVSAQLAYQAAE